jgi:hypothetical protein
MHRLITVSAGRRVAMFLTLGIGLVACTPASSQPAASAGGPGSSSAASAGQPLPSGGVDVQGSLVSSGIYAATWTWQAGNAAGPGIGGITLNSDKGTFGNVEVVADGSITFTSGAPELSSNAVYKGSGAQVQLKDQIPCGFTLDNDVTGSDDGRVLHLKGTLTIKGTAFNC